MEKGRDKRIILVLMTLTIIFTLMGGTLSYLRWQTSEGQKTNVVFTVNSSFSCAADGGGNIESATLVPASCTNKKYAIQREVVVTPEIKGNGMAIAMDLWLDINVLGSGLSKSEYFRYALTTVENDCTSGIVSEGRFTGLSSENDDKVMLLDGQQFTKSGPQTYYLYIWIDSLEENNYIVDQSFNFSLGGNCSELYTVNYDLNGGDEIIETQIKDENQNLTLSNVVPVRFGYKFLGWSTNKGGTIVEYQPGDDYEINQSVTLYAVWLEFNPVESYSCANGSAGSEPYAITYTGDCTMIDDGNSNWRIKLLSSGDLTFLTDLSIDAFLVGGGGGGNYSGGAGGYTKTSKALTVEKNVKYEIIVGLGGNNAAGGQTSAFDVVANGGARGENTYGGSGGSGGGGFGGDTANAGTGGNDGSNAYGSGYRSDGAGQKKTTKEFGEETGELYAGGGGGSTRYGAVGQGGAGGGGAGHKIDYNSPQSGVKNTGGGGGGSFWGGGGAGGDGIVVIRNSNVACASGGLANVGSEFIYTGNCEAINDGDGNWRIKLLTSGDLTFSSDVDIDAFLVGGGGGGNYSGGGGGYTETSKAIQLQKEVKYSVIVGLGGINAAGGQTSAFNVVANGGARGENEYGGSGGSGGGGFGGDTANAGTGGSNGSNAYGSGYRSDGTGQGRTTREFGEETGQLYAGGGGGSTRYGEVGQGGEGGGGIGHKIDYNSPQSGVKNTGSGGGGSFWGGGGNGGSGIVVIRNKR